MNFRIITTARGDKDLLDMHKEKEHKLIETVLRKTLEGVLDSLLEDPEELATILSRIDRLSTNTTDYKIDFIMLSIDEHQTLQNKIQFLEEQLGG